MYLASFTVLCTVLATANSFGLFKPHLDPEDDMNVTEMISYSGYPAEEYTVETEDGYLIYIQRIPGGRNEFNQDTCDQDSCPGPKPVVFLQHGMLCASSNWVANFPNQSLGFLMADAGFDVWLGNVRGNTYGLRHIKYKTNSNTFWDFSWDEMAQYDLPAMLKFVTTKTAQSSLYYIGHSQGTTIGFAEFSTNKELAKMVKTFFALAPVGTIGHTKTPFLTIPSETSMEIKMVHSMLGKRDFLPSGPMVQWFGKHICSKTINQPLCADVMFTLCGFDRKNLNNTRIPVYVTHTPAGTSVKNAIHWLQMVNSKKFQRYDYGFFGNKRNYGQRKTPLYNLQSMTLPVVVYSGENDWLADPKDVQYLLSQLPNVIHSVEIPKWNHLDFIYGLDAAPVVYNEIIEYIQHSSE
ncbi:lysosomal acid lipase/cholesteryl ester hydrolase-like [Montipora capricornis]|uniref:lysosomal acid lipase/cholesteryl ester hydrolase-like n=1 Tax=Montipora capricornis TaxID=246305 RepID=UPI0035F13650